MRQEMHDVSKQFGITDFLFPAPPGKNAGRQSECRVSLVAKSLEMIMSFKLLSEKKSEENQGSVLEKGTLETWL
jgi:hypothetical protein